MFDQATDLVLFELSESAVIKFMTHNVCQHLSFSLRLLSIHCEESDSHGFHLNVAVNCLDLDPFLRGKEKCVVFSDWTTHFQIVQTIST